MPFTKISPRQLTNAERSDLRRMLGPVPSDDAFDRFVSWVELALGCYTNRVEFYQAAIPGADARQACEEILQSAKKLRSSWNKAPAEARQLLDIAHQLRQLENDAMDSEEHAVFLPAFGEFSVESKLLFGSIGGALEMIIEAASSAAETPTSDKKGGRPRNTPLYFLANDIAQAFLGILDAMPTTTATGPYSEVLHYAVQLVGNETNPSDLSRYVRTIVKAIKKPDSTA